MQPLAWDDPPKIGDFWLDARAARSRAGVAYIAHDDTRRVLVVTMASGASQDAAARARLAGAVNELDLDTVVARGGEGQADGRLGRRYRAEDDDPELPGLEPVAPWVALAFDGSDAAVGEARRLLDRVDLEGLSLTGSPAGPDFAHDWHDDEAPGRWRLWPLPWPGRHDRAGILTIAAAWLLMMLIMCLAVLVAILMFQHAPQQAPPPPVPTSASGSGSPQSGSPSGSPSSGQPSSASASPSSASASPSPSGSGSPSGGTPTPPSKL